MMACVWRFIDGKIGHERQSLGLLKALSERHQFKVETIDVRTERASWWQWLRASYRPRAPAPDLLIGAGSLCQFSMLAAQRANGGRSIYLMKPKFPIRWFDLCLIPIHDQNSPRSNVIHTTGVLNDVAPGKSLDPTRGLMLIGGPSAHFDWNEDEIVRQIENICHTMGDVEWTATSSRRTPPATIGKLLSIEAENFRFVAASETEADWLPNEMQNSGRIWVSADSISMIYESMSSGACVGVFTVPAKKSDRITQAAEKLFQDKRLVDLETMAGTKTPPMAPLQEAARCAELISARFPDLLGGR